MMAQWIIHTQEQQRGVQFRPPTHAHAHPPTLGGERGERAAPGQIRGELAGQLPARPVGDSRAKRKYGKTSRSQRNGEASGAD